MLAKPWRVARIFTGRASFAAFARTSLMAAASWAVELGRMRKLVAHVVWPCAGNRHQAG